MKKFLSFLIISFIFYSVIPVNALNIKNIYWEPAEPVDGEKVTVYAEIEGNVTSVTMQYCIGDACYLMDVQKVGENLWKGNFTAKKGDIEIKVIVKEDDEPITKKKIMHVKAKKTPGFEVIILLLAIIYILHKKQKAK